MINEINQELLNKKYIHDLKPCDEDFLLCYRDNQVLLKESGDDYELPRRNDFMEPGGSPVYLFSISSSHYFGIFDSLKSHPSFEFHDIFVLRTLKNKELAWLGALGHQLMVWHHNHQYCGRCGSRTGLKKDERATVCPTCNLITFPTISPAIIVVITCNNRILLAKGKNWKNNLYSLLAGYVEAGESIEETVVREVKEEVGVDIYNLKYYKSQPWPFSASLMLGFTAEADDTQPIIIDENEIKEAHWFDRDNLPPHVSGISISGDLITAFEQGKI